MLDRLRVSSCTLVAVTVRDRNALCAWKWWIIVSNTLIWRCLVLSNIVLTFLWLRHCQQLWCIFLSCYFFFVSYVISAADSCFQLDTSVLITRMRLLASLAAHRCSNLHTCTCTPTRGCLLNRRHAANVNCCCLIGVSVKTILLFLAKKNNPRSVRV